VTAAMVQVRVWQVKRSTLSSVDRLVYCYGNYLMTSFHQVIYYFIHWIVWLIWWCFVSLCEVHHCVSKAWWFSGNEKIHLNDIQSVVLQLLWLMYSFRNTESTSISVPDLNFLDR